MKLNLKAIKKKLINKKINFITIDGITCSGKTLFSNILKKKINNSLLISKDIFLLPRVNRIRITKMLKNKCFYDQNILHYDLSKLKLLILFLLKGNRQGKLVLKKLYNRKNGINNLTQIFYFKPNRLIIFEGIYSNEDIKKIIRPSIKILITEHVYTSLFRKIERIRDRKISIESVVAEFTRIHLTSYKKYLKQNFFDLIYSDLKKNFILTQDGKAKQIFDIRKFLFKHLN
jgi:uridine kinase